MYIDFPNTIYETDLLNEVSEQYSDNWRMTTATTTITASGLSASIASFAAEYVDMHNYVIFQFMIINKSVTACEIDINNGSYPLFMDIVLQPGEIYLSKIKIPGFKINNKDGATLLVIASIYYSDDSTGALSGTSLYFDSWVSTINTYFTDVLIYGNNFGIVYNLYFVNSDPVNSLTFDLTIPNRLENYDVNPSVWNSSYPFVDRQNGYWEEPRYILKDITVASRTTYELDLKILLKDHLWRFNDSYHDILFVEKTAGAGLSSYGKIHSMRYQKSPYG